MMNHEKYNCMIEIYKGLVYKIAFARFCNKYDADDVFQEVFLKIYKSNKTFKEANHEKAWVIRVTVNCCYDYKKNLKRHTHEELVDAMEQHGNPETDYELEDYLKKLKPKERLVIHLYYYEGLTTKKIASVLKCTDSNIRVCLSRTRKKIKIMIGEDFNERKI